MHRLFSSASVGAEFGCSHSCPRLAGGHWVSDSPFLNLSFSIPQPQRMMVNSRSTVLVLRGFGRRTEWRVTPSFFRMVLMSSLLRFDSGVVRRTVILVNCKSCSSSISEPDSDLFLFYRREIYLPFYCQRQASHTRCPRATDCHQMATECNMGMPWGDLRAWKWWHKVVLRLQWNTGCFENYCQGQKWFCECHV